MFPLVIQLTEKCVEGVLVADKHLARLAALCLTNDAGLLELVHETSGAVVAYGEMALNLARRALLCYYDHPGGLLEERV